MPAINCCAPILSTKDHNPSVQAADGDAPATRARPKNCGASARHRKTASDGIELFDRIDISPVC